MMAKMGIDTEKFQAHSIRAVSASTAIDAGVPAEEVARGRWASPRTMRVHYDRSNTSAAAASSSSRTRRVSTRCTISSAVLGAASNEGNCSVKSTVKYVMTAKYTAKYTKQ